MSDLPTCDCYETFPGPSTHRPDCRVRAEVERLTAKTEIDKITMDNFLGQIKGQEVEIERLQARVEQLEGDLGNCREQFIQEYLEGLSGRAIDRAENP